MLAMRPIFIFGRLIVFWLVGSTEACLSLRAGFYLIISMPTSSPEPTSW